MSKKRSLLGRLASFVQRWERRRQSAKAPLSLEWATYQSRKPELLASEGQWVVIHRDQILGILPTYEEALRLGYKQAGFADFLVHQILAFEPVYQLPYRSV